MLFHSYGFLFLFFPLTFAGYYICQRKCNGFRGVSGRGDIGKVLLLILSLVFYGWGHAEYLPVLIVSMAVNYGIFLWMKSAASKKTVFCLGILFDLAVLICFKYIGIGDYVPPAVSFFTFTQIAFLAEGYQGNLKDADPISYGLYVSFFPKIMQGPIALPQEMFQQFAKGKRQIDWEKVFRSLCLFVLGLFKKVLIADTLGKAADFGYANLAALNSGDGLIVMLSYTLQLYFDFSGYCDMAMGIGGMLGIELPLNFDSPYKASNILEFWKRWHMTLTRFFTRYLYIPLGGSRKGKIRTYFNCLLVFFISGLWHGAGWQFIIWGMMHGALYVLTRAFKDAGICTGKGTRMGKGIGTFFTFLYVNVAWIFFRAPSVKEAAALIKKIVSLQFGKWNRGLAGCFNLDEFWYVIKVFKLDSWQYAHYILMVLFLAAALILVFFGKSAVSYAKKVKPDMLHVLLMAVLFVWSVLSLSGVRSFLYVNF